MAGADSPATEDEEPSSPGEDEESFGGFARALDFCFYFPAGEGGRCSSPGPGLLI
jgi:hypothetical protein